MTKFFSKYFHINLKPISFESKGHLTMMSMLFSVHGHACSCVLIYLRGDVLSVIRLTKHEQKLTKPSPSTCKQAMLYIMTKSNRKSGCCLVYVVEHTCNTPSEFEAVVSTQDRGITR